MDGKQCLEQYQDILYFSLWGGDKPRNNRNHY